MSQYPLLQSSLFVVASALLAFGCTYPSHIVVGDGAIFDGDALDVHANETSISDTVVDTADVPVGDTSGCRFVSQGDAAITSDAGPTTRGFGSVCRGPDECDSNLCDNGKCTATCTRACDCPDSANWICSLLGGGEICHCTATGAEHCNHVDDDCDGIVDNNVDVSSDVLNCGACFHACPTGGSCANGQCACPTGMMACGGACVDTAADRVNCGTCGHTCATGESCSNGVCCGGVQQSCGGICRDLQADSNNCGACGNICGSFGTCDHGSCNCTGGQSSCTDGCHDLQVDNANCGTCGNICAIGATCTAGLCVCPGASLPCGGMCRDLSTDPTACGGCGNVCNLAAGESCMSGVCCASPHLVCSGVCADLTSDPNNCNACGSTCPTPPNSTPTCSGSHCSFACTNGFQDCDANPGTGCEAHLADDVANCGSCNSPCPMRLNSSPVCSNATCGVSCNIGFGNCDTLVSTGCEANLNSDASNCGGCGLSCPSGQHSMPLCGGGTCSLVCNGGFGDCDTNPTTGCETDTTTSAANCGACGHACPPGAMCAFSGCTFPSSQAEGSFNPSSNVVLPPGIHNFTTINVAAGITVTTNGPGLLDLRASGNVTIAGVIDVSGGAGGNGVAPVPCNSGGGGGGATGNVLAVGSTGGACPGGNGGNGSGGSPGTSFAPACAGGAGMNGGGGGGAIYSGGGGGGGFAGGGGGGCAAGGVGGGQGASAGGSTGGSGGNGSQNGSSNFCTGGGGGIALGPYTGNAGSGNGPNTQVNGCGGGGGSIGASAATDLAVSTTFYTGSGGGGGGTGNENGCGAASAGGGGGGGGAIRIATTGQITVTGSIRANGGNGGASATVSLGSTGGGGGGSGGLIELRAPTVNITSSGTLSATGGAGGMGAIPGGTGGLGRIRLAVNSGTCTLTGTLTPPASSGCSATSGPGVGGHVYISPFPN